MDNLKQGMVSIYLSQLLSTNCDEIVIKGDINRFRDFIYIDDVIKSLKKVSPDTEFKHMKWSPKSSGGGHHRFAIKESVNELKFYREKFFK